ncbi:UNVERIFIED_CONTAM: protein MKS1 [Sesamum calycinum]|uniref:Protein MKS1 n=1 Tax=Sesamum calycinum TaxID=2727403 RepID=A0AAW2IUP2_9LAMI
MDMPDIPSGRSPKRELQGPRPTPLKVRKDSHKIKKPPVAPPPAVQRLTGPNSTCTPSTNSPTTSSSSSAFAFQDYGGAISPAARFASIEKTKSPDGIRKTVQVLDQSIGIVEGVEIRPDIQRTTGQFPGILSPNPNTLPPIPPNFFSPPSENYNPLSFFHDLSPVLHSNRNNNYNLDILPSPSTFIISPQINMPSPNTLDLFHSLFDL